jgi:uroporphyrinogen decarboxylase
MIKPNSGKELLYRVFNRQIVDRPCWILYSGMHACSLLGYNSFEVLKDEEKLLESLLAVNELYSPDGMPVIFDLQLEAEILGCELAWDSKQVPIVKSHPLESAKTFFPPIPGPDQGRLPLILNVAKRLKNLIGEQTALFGLVTGPLTLAFQLRGMLIFMDLYDDEPYFSKLINYCTQVCIRIADYYINAGVDVIGVVDPLISQITPDIFTRFLSPEYKNVFTYLRSGNMFSSLIVCGNASGIIEDMAKTKPDCISVDGNINIMEIKYISKKYNIILSGNIPVNNTLIFGNQRDNHKYAIKLIEEMGFNDFILAPGCDLPYDVPRENIIGISQAVQNFGALKLFLLEYSLIKKYTSTKKAKDPSKIVLEIFTFNPGKCKICNQIIDIVRKFSEELKLPIELIEQNLSFNKSITEFKRNKLKNIPSVLINGVVCYNATSFDKDRLILQLRKILS